MDKHSESVMNGTLFEDFGVDLLGLKDIQGLNISSIPSELWNRKSSRSTVRARVRRRAVAETYFNF